MNDEESRTSSESVAFASNPEVVYRPDPDETNAEAIVTAMSSASGTAKTELDPIYEAVDPDALNSLFGPRESGTPPDGDGHVAFDYGSHRVRVGSDGTVVVY